ncbi:flagellar basal body rod protein FlgB [Thalassobacillus sp. B23F22_16]|uniref:flagellar basal body rod protein FlgB n=1 Tax=Thalassobacillus sp. B23F22_16 TaxID=3459513 RepID=UPI00373E8EEB
MNLFGGTIQTLEHSLNYASKKNNTIANNIANVDTPGYKAKKVLFKEVLAEKQKESISGIRTHPQHLPIGGASNGPMAYKVVKDNGTAYNHNGNNVDIDKEMNELAKNQLFYQSMVDRLNGKFRSLETVIKGGR